MTFMTSIYLIMCRLKWVNSILTHFSRQRLFIWMSRNLQRLLHLRWARRWTAEPAPPSWVLLVLHWNVARQHLHLLGSQLWSYQVRWNVHRSQCIGALLHCSLNHSASTRGSLYSQRLPCLGRSANRVSLCLAQLVCSVQLCRRYCSEMNVSFCYRQGC